MCVLFSMQRYSAYMGGEDRMQMWCRLGIENREDKHTVDDRSLFKGREYSILS